MEEFFEKLDELSNWMPTYIDWLEYKHGYPETSIGVYDANIKQIIYQDNVFSPMPFNKWKELFKT